MFAIPEEEEADDMSGAIRQLRLGGILLMFMRQKVRRECTVP